SAYTLDQVGNRLTYAGPNSGTTYNYDAVYNLLSSSPGTNTNTGPEAYTYDLVGNRLTGPQPNGAYTYNQNNQLVTENQQQLQFDKNGNLISGATGSNAFSYDYENRLISVAGSGLNAQYQYD